MLTRRLLNYLLPSYQDSQTLPTRLAGHLKPYFIMEEQRAVDQVHLRHRGLIIEPRKRHLTHLVECNNSPSLAPCFYGPNIFV